MSRYFYLGRFIEQIKERYPKIIKLIVCFDPRKSIEKTKYNKLQLHLNDIVIVDNEKKYAINDLKKIRIYDNENDDGETDDTKHIISTRISNYLMLVLN
jgi:hypothetical protein